jgi:hypothetical protein
MLACTVADLAAGLAAAIAVGQRDSRHLWLRTYSADRSCSAHVACIAGIAVYRDKSQWPQWSQ